MRTRGMWMLLVALLAGMAAVVLALRWMQGQGGERDRIAVASVDIGLGARLTPQMIRLTEWPRGSVPAGAFAQADPLDGRVVTVAIQRGEPLTEARLAPVGARAGLSAVVPPGKRAMTVRVNDVVGVAGFALPGTTVDVLVNTQHEGGRRGDVDRAVSKIVLERILVLAVAQEADRDTSRPKVVSAVTLEVTPDQAEKLDLARSVGTLSLVLRNPADPQDAATVGATKAALLGDVATVALAPSARQRTVTRGLSNPQAKPARTGSSATPPSGKGVGASTTSAPSLTHDPVPDLEVRAVAALAPAPVETVTATPPKTCVEILAGATRRTECF